MKKSIKKSAVEVASLGIDLADQWSDWVTLDDAGVVIERGRVKTTEPHLRAQFGPMAPTVIAIEVGTHSAWVSRVLRSCGHRVVVANARKVALIHQNRRKNNRIDAEFLARLVRVDEKLLFPIEHRSEEGQQDLTILRSRDVLVGARTKLVNHVRGISKAAGVRLPICSTEAFVKKCGPALPTGIAPAVKVLLEHITQMTTHIRDYDRTIDKMPKKYPAAKLLMQITGVGALTAVAYVLTVEDVHRIARSRSAGAYFGLVPGSDDSGEDHEPGRITKEGDRYVRRLLVAAGHYIIGRFGPDCDLRRHGLGIAARGGKNAKKRAVVAVARKLGVLMHRLWLTGEVYEPLYNANRQQVAA